jgi:hypothetical protein
MAYYLVRYDEQFKKIQIVASCTCHTKKNIVLDNYCKNNDIKIVTDRVAVTENCKGVETFAYQIRDNKYIILDCIEHPDGYIRYRYVQKMVNGYLEFLYFKDTEFPLSKIKNTLKMKTIKQNKSINGTV